MLKEKYETNNSVLSKVTVVGSHTDCGVAASSVQDTVGNDSTLTRKNFLVFIGSHLLKELADGGNFRLLNLSDLNENHGESDQSALTNKIFFVSGERSQNSESILRSSASTSNTKRESSTISQVRVVADCEVFNDDR